MPKPALSIVNIKSAHQNTTIKMAEASLAKFDPEACPQGTFEAFSEFVDQFAYEYDAIAKNPPREETDTAAWIQQNKRKIFLGKYSSRALQKEYEDCTTENERDAMTFTDMVKTLKDRFKIGSNTTLANYKFHKLGQNVGESYDAFIIRVKHEANNCDFSCANAECTVRDTLIRDQIIVGTMNDEVRRCALKEQWDLQNLVNKGRSLESATKGAEIIKKEESVESFVSRTKPGKYSRKSEKKKSSNFQPASRNTDGKQRCLTCSSSTCQGKNKCPAYELTCFDCNKKGHFRGAKACNSRSKHWNRRSRRLEETDSESEENYSDESPSSSDRESTSSDNEVKFTRSRKHITKIRRTRRTKYHQKQQKPRYQVDVIIKEKIVPAFADTGADICIMSKKTATDLQIPIHKTKMKIKPYGSKKVKCCGEYTGTIMFADHVANTSIYIIDHDVETLLSGKVSEDLNIIEYNPIPIRQVGGKNEVHSKIVEDYPDVFSGLGTLKNHEVKFHIDPDFKPVAQPARPVPFHLRKKFEQEITKMEENGIIEEHHGPAPWISNVVLAPKDDGKMRVTVDMRQANKAIRSTNVPIPRVEEVKAKLSGCKVFSKLDFNSAFHQLKIDEESRYITVFHAGNRLMRYKKLTMGTKPASGELNKALTPLFKDIANVHMIHDDLIISTETEEQHNEVVHQTLKIIQKSGMTLNEDKCFFIQKEIPFWGVRITEDGIKPDPEKVNALHHASRPKSKEELSSFLCMVQSNKDFIDRIAHKTQHLRKLSKKNVQFKWDVKCEREFKDLKESFKEDTLLRHFDPESTTWVAVDAHKYGLSAILLQGESIDAAKPVSMASRATSPVEERYPQLDLEALAIDFALRRYRYYLIGGPQVTIITDHKPLVSIFTNVRKGSIRIDRIKLRHQDMDYKVEWRKGKENPADYLSRHAIPFKELPKKIQKESKEFEKTVWYLQYSPYTESISMEKIIEETNKDETLIKLKKQIQKGFIPKSCHELASFRKVFCQLTISDEGLVLKDERIVLPGKLCGTALSKAHQGSHPGMNSLKRRIRSHFWMPGLNKAVEKMVKSCPECLLFSSKTTKEPISSQKVPEAAWQNVSVDLFGPMPNNKHVLVVTDNMSRFPAAKMVPSTAAKPVVSALDQIYTDYGEPDSHRTDNGPPFNSQEFDTFTQDRGIEHIKTFPYHPQANPAETFMRPLGKTMKSAMHSKQSPEQALNNLLSNYRATPHPTTNNAPGDVMLRYGYKKDFPRKPISQGRVDQGRANDIAEKKERQERINKSNHRMKSNYRIGDKVYIKNNKKTKFDPLFGPTIHEVIETKDGGVITQSQKDNTTSRRHLDDIKEIPADEPPTAETETNTASSSTNPTACDMVECREKADDIPRRSTRERHQNPKYADYVMHLTAE